MSEVALYVERTAHCTDCEITRESPKLCFHYELLELMAIANWFDRILALMILYISY